MYLFTVYEPAEPADISFEESEPTGSIYEPSEPVGITFLENLSPQEYRLILVYHLKNLSPQVHSEPAGISFLENLSPQEYHLKNQSPQKKTYMNPLSPQEYHLKKSEHAEY